MQKLSLFSALVLLSTSTFAQDGYFVKAGSGIASSTSSFSVVNGDAFKGRNHITTGQMQLSAGYNRGNLQLEAGIGYLRTGVTFVAANGVPGCMPSPVAPPPPTEPHAVRYTIKNSHITVPVTASYAMKVCKKVTLYPGAGLEAMYNLKGKMTSNQPVESSYTTIHYDYNNFGVALLLKFEVQYKLCEHMSVFVNPSYMNMLSSLTTKVGNDGMSRTYDRAMMLSAGVTMNMHCCTKATRIN